jgi:hypothetical protein
VLGTPFSVLRLFLGKEGVHVLELVETVIAEHLDGGLGRAKRLSAALAFDLIGLFQEIGRDLVLISEAAAFL